MKKTVRGADRARQAEIEARYERETCCLRGEIGCLRSELHARSGELFKVQAEVKIQAKLNLILVAALEKILLGTVEVAQHRVSQ